MLEILHYEKREQISGDVVSVTKIEDLPSFSPEGKAVVPLIWKHHSETH
jgi:hypothetical protein